MQSLEVISVNIWQIIVSLCNLVILFLLLKRFLYKPVRETLAKRKAMLDGVYAEADSAKNKALADRAEYEKRLAGAASEAENICQNAILEANRRSDKLLAEAHDKAAGIVKKAESDAEIERKNAAEGIRREIADGAAEVAGKLIGREMKDEDQRRLVDSFIDELYQDGKDEK